MAVRNSGRLAIHRRSDEIAFLQHRLRILNSVSLEIGEPRAKALVNESETCHGQNSASTNERRLELEVLMRERDLTDELLHTRQTEPLGETLQRRLAMAERICHDLALCAKPKPQADADAERSQEPHARTGDHDDRASGQVDQTGSRDGADRRVCLSDAYWVAVIERRALAEMLGQWWAWLRES